MQNVLLRVIKGYASVLQDVLRMSNLVQFVPVMEILTKTNVNSKKLRVNSRNLCKLNTKDLVVSADSYHFIDFPSSFFACSFLSFYSFLFLSQFRISLNCHSFLVPLFFTLILFILFHSVYPPFSPFLPFVSFIFLSFILSLLSSFLSGIIFLGRLIYLSILFHYISGM